MKGLINPWDSKYWKLDIPTMTYSQEREGHTRVEDAAVLAARFNSFEQGAAEYGRYLKEQDSTFEGKVYDKLGVWVFIEEE